jgi:hypothetical protein
MVVGWCLFYASFSICVIYIIYLDERSRNWLPGENLWLSLAALIVNKGSPAVLYYASGHCTLFRELMVETVGIMLAVVAKHGERRGMRAEISKVDLRVARRIRGTRLFRDISAELAAQYLNLTLNEYTQCEAGQRNFAAVHLKMLSTLFRVSSSFLTGTRGVDTSSNVIDICAHLLKQRKYYNYTPPSRSAEASR